MNTPTFPGFNLKGNYTQTPNAFFDVVLADKRVNPAAFKVLAFIVRKTCGFHKPEDDIALSQFTIGTGLSKKTVIAALKQLENTGYIECGPGSKGRGHITSYKLKGEEITPFNSESEQISDNFETEKGVILNTKGVETTPFNQIKGVVLARKGVDITPTKESTKQILNRKKEKKEEAAYAANSPFLFLDDLENLESQNYAIPAEEKDIIREPVKSHIPRVPERITNRPAKSNLSSSGTKPKPLSSSDFLEPPITVPLEAQEPPEPVKVVITSSQPDKPAKSHLKPGFHQPEPQPIGVLKRVTSTLDYTDAANRLWSVIGHTATAQFIQKVTHYGISPEEVNKMRRQIAGVEMGQRNAVLYQLLEKAVQDIQTGPRQQIA